jgi:hypothetical protein
MRDGRSRAPGPCRLIAAVAARARLGADLESEKEIKPEEKPGGEQTHQSCPPRNACFTQQR